MFKSPGCQLMGVAVLFTGLGYRKPSIPCGEGWSRQRSNHSSSKYCSLPSTVLFCFIHIEHVNNWKKVSSWSSSRIRPSLPFYDCNLSSCSISSHEWSGVNIVHFIYIHICSYQRQMFFLPYAVLHWFTTSRILLHRNHKYCPGLMIFLCLPQSAKISRALQS